MNPQNNKNLILATSLSVVIMISWTWFYEKPRLEKISLQHQIEQSNQGSKDEKISDKISAQITKTVNIATTLPHVLSNL